LEISGALGMSLFQVLARGKARSIDYHILGQYDCGGDGKNEGNITH